MAARENNFFHMFVGMLFLLLGVPLIRDLTDTGYSIVSELAFTITILIGVWSLHRSGRWFYTAILAMLLGAVGNFLTVRGGGQATLYVSLVAYIIFFLLSVTLASRQVFDFGRVNGNKIIGAICIYLLLGVLWSLFYLLVNMLIPGSFGDQVTGDPYQQLHDFLYYSFVTLTSLGYGEITPVGATARALSVTEVIFGQFYIAVLVAALVANYLDRSDAD